MFTSKRKVVRAIQTLADREAERLAAEHVKQSERRLAQRDDPEILSDVVLEVLKQSIDPEAGIIDRGDIKPPTGPARIFRFNGCGGNLVMAVWQKGKSQAVELRRLGFPPLYHRFVHPDLDGEVSAPAVTVHDVKAWVGYVETVSSGSDPRLEPDDDPARMHAHMAEVGHKAILDHGADPDKLAALAQTYIDDRMRESDVAAHRLVGGVALGQSA